MSAENSTSPDPIGYIVGGSLKQNLRVRLSVDPQQVQEGSFVTILSQGWKFYGLVTDMELGSTDPRFADEQSELRLPRSVARLLHGQTLFTNLEVLPALMLEVGPEPGEPDFEQRKREWEVKYAGSQPQLLPIKTVPSHHAPVMRAHAGDVADIFGDPAKEENFILGYTREQGHPVCVNLPRFVQRSAGIFGATGSGKSFLTRLMLAGLIKYDKASVLVLDMHNEYGFDDTSPDTGERVTGLQTKFKSRVRVVGLGRGTTVRGKTPDFHLEFAESDITGADIEMLTRELNLKETTPTTLDALWRCFGSNWLHEFKAMSMGETVLDDEGKKVPAPGSVEYWARVEGVNELAASSLKSKLSRVFNRDYIVEHPAADSLGEIIRTLEAGKHIILSFGEYESDLDYLLVANILTRRLREAWVQKTNRYRGHGENEPRQLVIVVEEAHKLLNREMASQTAFSTIARELRKYYVTLLIVDQRPSQIDDEVLSQLGTRISGALGDESDIQAALSGQPSKDSLRGMLSRLQPKEEVLLLGWGVKMPLPIRSRRYDDKFWEELLGRNSPSDQARALKELGF